MLTKAEAKSLVEAEINQPDPYWPEKRVQILYEATLERQWGWVFFYQSSEYLETHKPSAALVGNAPYIVNKNTGELMVTGTAWPVEKYLEEYEERLLSDE